MKKKRIFKILTIVVIIGIATAGGVAFYLFNMPHRNVLATKADFSLTSTEIVNEYLNHKDGANEKYLAADGESKILEITGVVSKISEDFNGQKVVLLKDENDNAGVSATLTTESGQLASVLQIGQTITIKGVIRAGASYDEDLEMYENVILEKSSIVTKQ
ncbi:MAG: hypothetical protein PF485_11605 [Bacteroidales bacterium]|jgi:hypothetical protein|nr:hypothetical protein [Bacteroidales bacterium]